MAMTIREVWEKYRHEECLCVDCDCYVLVDLWLAIEAHCENEIREEKRIETLRKNFYASI